MLLGQICCDINERVVERAFQCYSYVFRCGRRIQQYAVHETTHCLSCFRQ